ncbi:MAG: SbcC/MukB-like Walker B domain-containing protein, partial [Methanomassiliicoccales archaeon]
RIIPALGERSTSLFVEMTDARYQGIELDEDYRIHVYDSGERYEIDRFSGGEGDLANLCLRLAISRVISDRSGSPVNFLVLDEIFGSQDRQRKRNIMRTLNSLSRQFRQIVLITHIDDLKEFMENVVYVRENEDGSSDLVLDT